MSDKIKSVISLLCGILIGVFGVYGFNKLYPKLKHSIKNRLVENVEPIVIKDTIIIHDTITIEKSAFDFIKEFKNTIVKQDTIK